LSVPADAIDTPVLYSASNRFLTNASISQWSSAERQGEIQVRAGDAGN